MVKSLENGTSLAPFLVKCYEMVEDESTDGLISWNHSNQSFIIWDESKFSSQLLPKYFKHSNFSSFVRQLNIYGFRKIDTDRWEFANEAFVIGQKNLMKNITRRKQPPSQTPQSPPTPEHTVPVSSAEEKRAELWKEVESLKIDKNALTLELKKLRQHQQSSQSKLLLVREQLKGMEKNQQQMLSFIVMAMQSPEFLEQLLQPKENNWRIVEAGKNKLSEVTDDREQVPPDGTIIRYHPPLDGDRMPASSASSSNSEDLMELDLSSDELRDLFINVDLLLGSVDENSLPLESNAQLVLPDVPEYDAMLDQLLLSTRLTGNELFSDVENRNSLDFGAQAGSIFQPKESELLDDSNDEIEEELNAP